MTPDSHIEETIYFVHRSRALLWVGGLLFGITAVTVIGVEIGMGGIGGLVRGLVATGLGGLLFILPVALARTSLSLEQDGIVIRNFLLTRRVPWEQIRRFSLNRGARRAQVDLLNATAIPIYAIQVGRADWLLKQTGRAEAVVDGLNRRVETVRTQHPPYPAP